MKRRDFLKWSATMAGLIPAVEACRSTNHRIPGKIIGASAGIGHMLRDQHFGDPSDYSEQDVVIVGGGISGLSAARYLTKNGVKNITLLDVELKMGGNSAYGSNTISRYPWGAHYIPVPNNNLQEYLEFLQESDVITAYDEKGLPVYNEYFLCQDPEERLYINGSWQEGLIPRLGIAPDDKAQFDRFFKLMQEYRVVKGSDGKDAFAIPVNESSCDQNFIVFDEMTMKSWMQHNNLNSGYLQWYVDYCTRDDFGTTYDKISAWTGIHYFASRKGRGNNASYHDVLTWEEGNGFLAGQLLKAASANKLNHCVATSVKSVDGFCLVNYYDVNEKKLKGIKARHCVVATPQFVAARLLNDKHRKEMVSAHMSYVPWMVANITVDKLQERSGAGPSWDNVIYGGAGLGYVDATHQQTVQHKTGRNLTYYYPLTDGNPVQARHDAMRKTHEQWAELVVADLQKVHPGIEKAVRNIDIMLWGHAMAQPLPGTIFGNLRKELQESIDGRIHFAHTDLAGISIFEEAFYQGIQAAKKIMAT